MINLAPQLVEHRPHIKDQNFVAVILDTVIHPGGRACLNFQITFDLKDLRIGLEI